MRIPDGFTVELTHWQQDAEALFAVRETVFIVEQQVPREEEVDDLDPPSLHALARDPAGQPIATGRLTPLGSIGRMAVLADWRGRGVGQVILQTLIDAARARGLRTLWLHAQTHALAFYAGAGFVAEGAAFDECGIPHQRMTLSLPPREVPERPAGPRREPVSRSELLAVVDYAGLLTASLQLLDSTRHQFRLYSRDLDARAYDQEAFIDGVRRFVLAGSRHEVRVLLQDLGTVQTQRHRLIELMRRIDSRIRIRQVAEEDRSFPGAYVVNDSHGFLYRVHGDRPTAEGHTRAIGRAGELWRSFDEVWERASVPVELRRLGI
ncbi:MAG: GNAT family N-acetyltransferase [Xanthomonadales bacterium]|nr:GNAT family N-acetyltransferase [Xanthomonadales bacterium]